MNSDDEDAGYPRLHGYALTDVAGVRGEDLARVGPLGKMNFLVGRNNHGKSTLMRAAGAFVMIDGPKLSEREKVREVLVPVSRTNMERIVQQVGGRSQAQIRAQVEAVTVELEDPDWPGLWVRWPTGSNQDFSHAAAWTFLNVIGQERGFSATGLSIRPHLAGKAVLIPAFRQLRHAGDSRKPDLPSGEGLVEELDSWQHPRYPDSPTYLEAKEKWVRLRDFIRDVLEDDEAELEVAGGVDLHVRLAQAGRMLQISALGDGIKQVLMIAAACIKYGNHLVLLEEPEIHLHAGLQRKLMRFLADNTDNQYIVATHSAHVLDLPGARIFHVTHDGTSTRVAPAVRASDVHKVSHDLGYMASDILQANYTIWVEGPSDRIYWRRWLQLVDPDLEDGVHFAAMTYGGYLVDGMHIKGDEDEPVEEDLIALLGLGRLCTLIADSDKLADDSPPRPGVVRLAEQAAQPGSGHLVVCDWVSTVENLVPRTVFTRIVQGLHPQSGAHLKAAEHHSPFDRPFEGMTSFSKVRVAQAVAAELTSEHVTGMLRNEVEGLARRIREANGLKPIDSPAQR